MKIVRYKDAKSIGLKRYFTGEECRYGHISERLVSNRACIKCSKIKLKRWQKENPDKVRLLDRARHKRDGDKRRKALREYAKKNVKKATKRRAEWAMENREKAREIQGRWNKKNRHKINAYAANRRSLKKGAGKHTGDDIKELYNKQNGLCAACSEVLSKWHVDHIIPLSRGGANTKGNLQLLCKRCNLRKSDKDMEVFLSIIRGEHGET